MTIFNKPSEQKTINLSKDPAAVVIKYTNHRGETADRHIIPIRIRFGSTKWHQEEQWLLEAFDIDRDANRAFALKDVLQWRKPA